MKAQSAGQTLGSALAQPGPLLLGKGAKRRKQSMVLLSHPTPAPCGRGTLVGSTARKRRNLGPRDAKEPPEQLQEWACSAGLRMGPSAEILVVVFLLAVSFIGKPPAPAPLHRPGEASTAHVKSGTPELSAMPFPTSILQPGEESCASRCRGGWGSPITPHPVGEGSAHSPRGPPRPTQRAATPAPEERAFASKRARDGFVALSQL